MLNEDAAAGAVAPARDPAPCPTPRHAWRTDVETALVDARRDGKLVVDVWPDARVTRAVADRFGPVLIDTDRDGATTVRYGIEGILEWDR